MKVGGKNQFKSGRYSGPARPCRVCGTRTMNQRFVSWQRGTGLEHVGFDNVCADHALPHFSPERVTPFGTYEAMTVTDRETGNG